MSQQAGLIACRFLHFASLLFLFGSALYPLYAGDDGPADDPRSAQRWRVALAAGALTALGSGIGWYLFTATAMAGAADPASLLTVLTQTDFGPLWSTRLVIIAALLGLVLIPRTSRAARSAFVVLAALALASLAGTGHARVTQGWAGAIHMAADAIHLLAAGAWLGGLVPLGLAIGGWRAANNPQTVTTAHATLVRFSGMGSIAVAALVGSGVINGAFLLGSIPALWTSTYGQILAAKVLFFLLMLALAAANRYVITPQLANPSLNVQSQLGVLRQQVALEQVLGLIVIAIVSLLGVLPTPV